MIRSQLLVVLTLFSLVFNCDESPAATPNVLLICVDDLRPELGCFGVDYIQSPNIDQLAATGRSFHRHYVQAPTCGASRYALLTGLYGSYGNEALFARAKRIAKDADSVPPSLPAWFRAHGYTTVSIGKVSHHPGGRGGANWDDDDQPEMPLSWDRHLMPTGAWQHPRGAMHGLAHGEIRGQKNSMDLFQNSPGDDSIYPDGLMIESALQELTSLANDSAKPFFLAVGIIRPHLPFGCPEQYLEPYRDVTLPPIAHPNKPKGKTTWHGSGEFMQYNRWGRNPIEDPEFATAVRKAYAACVSYADAQVGKLTAKLVELGAADNTIVVLWGDHGWHLGEHAIWGKHALFEESLRSPLIIQYPGMPQPGAATTAIVETIDIFPTLCDLAELPLPPKHDGRSLRPLLDDPQSDGHPAVSYIGNAQTIRTKRYRLIVHKDNSLELYDHQSSEGEANNIAPQNPKLVEQLQSQLQKKRTQ